MEKTDLTIGAVVQLNPETVRNEHFKACFMVITEPKAFGAQGYVTVPGEGNAFYRAQWEEMEIIGEAIWVLRG